MGEPIANPMIDYTTAKPTNYLSDSINVYGKNIYS